MKVCVCVCIQLRESVYVCVACCQICQETAISERAHLEQRVEDLQTAILTVSEEEKTSIETQ